MRASPESFFENSVLKCVPRDIVVYMLQFFDPVDYVAALKSSKCFHPVDPIQHADKKEYYRKQRTFTLGEVKRGPKCVSIQIVNLLGQPCRFRTPTMPLWKEPQRKESHNYTIAMDAPSHPEMATLLDNIGTRNIGKWALWSWGLVPNKAFF